MAHTYWRLYITKTNSGGNPGIADWKLYDASNVLIATTSGTASASSTESGSTPASNAFDSNASTYWQSNAATSQWLRYQFASPVSVDHFTITVRSDRNDLGPQDFLLQYSDDDGSSWNTAFTYQGAIWTGAGIPYTTQTFYITGILYRLNFTATQGGGGQVGIGEWRLYDLVGAQISTAGACFLGSSQGGSNGGYPSLAFDGNCNTPFESSQFQSLPQYLSVHFPSVVNVGSIQVQAFSVNVGEAPATGSLQKSLDGANWTTVQSFTSATWVGSCQSQTFAVSATPNIALSPDSGTQGLTYIVTVTGTNTNFIAGVTTVSISGTGATVGSVSVSSTTSLTFTLAVSGSATIGARTVGVTTGSEAPTATFAVLSAGTAPSATVRGHIAWSQLRLGNDGRSGVGSYGQSTDGSGVNDHLAAFGGVDGKTLIDSGIATPGAGSGFFTAAGDLSGSNTSQTVVGLQGHPVSATAPTTGQLLQWNGSAWIPYTTSASGARITIGTRAAFSSSPPSAPAIGDQYICSDSPYSYTYNGSAWLAFFMGIPVTEPVSSNFSWYNQSTASLVTAYGGEQIVCGSSSTGGFVTRGKSYPGAAFTQTFGFQICGGNGGIHIRNATPNLLDWRLDNGAFTIGWDLWTSPNTPSGGSQIQAPSTMAPLWGPILFLRFKDDGTNRILSYSTDNRNFIQWRSESRTASFTPTIIGYGAQGSNSTTWLVHDSLTTP